MQTLFKDLRGRRVQAQDGIAGRVEDLFFDDRSGSIRHVVLSWGTWPRKRRVVVDPALMSADSNGRLCVAMTCAEVQRAPHPDSYPPISRQQQLNSDSNVALHAVVSGNEPITAEVPGPNELKNGFVPEGVELTPFDILLRIHRQKRVQAHLRSVRAVAGYGVEIESGRMGRVVDVWLDTATWHIAHLSLHVDAMKRRAAVPLSLVRGISCRTDTVRLSAEWSYGDGGLSLEPRVSPPSKKLRSLGNSFQFGSLTADVAS